MCFILSCSLLKALVTKWLHDYKQRNDLHAYSLLSHCYRYLCGGSGNNTLLSDPTLHRYACCAVDMCQLCFIVTSLQLTHIDDVYSRSFYRIIYGLMIKLFKRLIVELKKLNVVIVYASFSKIIVSADGKHDIPAAEEYISFIIDTILSKELFQNLEV